MMYNNYLSRIDKTSRQLKRNVQNNLALNALITKGISIFTFFLPNFFKCHTGAFLHNLYLFNAKNLYSVLYILYMYFFMTYCK